VGDGTPVWETAVELEPIVYYQLMLGWEDAPGVAAVYNDVDSCPSTDPNQPPCFTFSDPPTASELNQFDPQKWNWHYVRVINGDGVPRDGGWQRLTIE
jgi:hypothetical protein